EVLRATDPLSDAAALTRAAERDTEVHPEPRFFRWFHRGDREGRHVARPSLDKEGAVCGPHLLGKRQGDVVDPRVGRAERGRGRRGGDRRLLGAGRARVGGGPRFTTDAEDDPDAQHEHLDLEYSGSTEPPPSV